MTAFYPENSYYYKNIGCKTRRVQPIHFGKAQRFFPDFFLYTRPIFWLYNSPVRV